MITWLQHLLENDDTKVMYFLTIILAFSMIDLLIGWVNAKFNKDVSFSSSVALFGVIKKMTYFIVLCLFVPVSLFIPNPVGMLALYSLYSVYLYTEITSVLSHFNLAEDDKKNKLFIDFINSLIKKE
mgnify:FL=1